MKFWRWELKTHPKNREPQVQQIPDREQRRIALRDAVDGGGFQKLVVFSAGMGFMAGAYEIFATSLTMPMIKLVYFYPNKMHYGDETALRCATLIGAMFGQLLFGFLADLYGRRKMYGFELYVMIAAIIGIVMSSSGARGSMSIFGWLFAWRFIMGIGIGGDYPLSATITAEFAPTRFRAQMLATVFYMQPVGYLLATLVTLGVTAQHRKFIPDNPAVEVCDELCIQAVDRSWRTIIGIGAIPAVIALFFRRSIPESPLYTADVINQLEGAIEDMVKFQGLIAEQNGVSGPRTMNMPPIPVLDSRRAGETISEEEVDKFSYRWRTYWRSFYDHFYKGGFGWSLLGVSLAWLLLDTSFYALGSSSTTVVTKIFNFIAIGDDFECVESLGQATICTRKPNHEHPHDPDRQSFYGALFDNGWRSLIVVCIGSLSGGAGMIFLIRRHSPRMIQIWGFLILIVIFLAAGILLIIVKGDHVTIPVTIVYILAQIVFEMGPNFTTFMLPAEIFPTRHRAFAHGIAAASGKLGAAIFQVFFQFVQFHGTDDDGKGKTYESITEGTKWLGFTVLCFIPTMLVGAFVTWLLVPETRLEGGENRALDELDTLHGWARAKGGFRGR